MKYLLPLAILCTLYLSCKTEQRKENTYEDDVEMKHSEPRSNIEKPKISTTAEAIAYANGLKNWNEVKEIRFTFNVDRDTTHFERSWSWRPKEDLVTMTSEKDTITYNTKKVDSISQKADQGFINDKYWLLAPFNLVWDKESFTSKHQVKAVAPISNKEMQKLTITYKNEGGYTPGDAYDFYFEGDFIIKEWVFREKNAEKPSLITSWEDYNDYNGIKIAKTHNRNEGDWKLHFTNIEVITE
ncbi:hypothetical protein U6A24_14885 [Aquimarina gracilis]|uniref:Uncharacterized protein n=1 Tax=Aquimarina gracilis TaxID=874422 RepID=A0ABU5ZY27_9FLAO|nr:hypothetical protein [Aquimarina gracilis]MEB3346761.1 hypothetical protein [Aquimarina gracilis]